MTYIGYAQFSDKRIIGCMAEDNNQIILSDQIGINEDDYLVARDSNEEMEETIEDIKYLDDIWSAFYGYLYDELIIKAVASSSFVNIKVLLILDQSSEYETALIEVKNNEGELVPNIIESSVFGSEYRIYQELEFFEVVLDTIQNKYDDEYSKEIQTLFYKELNVNNRSKSMRNLKNHDIFRELGTIWREMDSNNGNNTHTLKIKGYEVKINNDSFYESFVEPIIDFSIGEYEEIQEYYIDEDIDRVLICSSLAKYDLFKDEVEELIGLETDYSLDLFQHIAKGLTFFAYIEGSNSQLLSTKEAILKQKQLKLSISTEAEIYELLRRDENGNYSYNEVMMKVGNTLSEYLKFNLLSGTGRNKVKECKMYLPFWSFNDTVRIRCSVDLNEILSIEFTHIETGVISVSTYNL